MDIYTVTFLGHRTINNMREVEERLDELIRKLLREKYYVDFLVGRKGLVYLLQNPRAHTVLHLNRRYIT